MAEAPIGLTTDEAHRRLAKDGPNAIVDVTQHRIPIRRWGQPSDFGSIAVYLASDASSYHTGETFIIDGGYTKFCFAPILLKTIGRPELTICSS